MKFRVFGMSIALAAFGLLGFPATASAAPSCVKDAPGCVNGAICSAAAKAGLQCVD